jgi:hypothetical protein
MSRPRLGNFRPIRGSYEVTRKLHGSRVFADMLLAGAGPVERWPTTRKGDRVKLARRLVRVLRRMIDQREGARG